MGAPLIDRILSFFAGAVGDQGFLPLRIDCADDLGVLLAQARLVAGAPGRLIAIGRAEPVSRLTHASPDWRDYKRLRQMPATRGRGPDAPPWAGDGGLNGRLPGF